MHLEICPCKFRSGLIDGTSIYISSYLFILEHKGTKSTNLSREKQTQCSVLYVTPPTLFFHVDLSLFLCQVSQVIAGLSSLHWLNMDLCSKLQVSKCTHTHSHTHTLVCTCSKPRFLHCLCHQSQGLWELYTGMELNMIPVLAGEKHFILLINPDVVHLWQGTILECPWLIE